MGKESTLVGILKKIWPQLQMEDEVLYQVGATGISSKSKAVGVTKCLGC